MKKLVWKSFRRMGGVVFKTEDFLIQASFSDSGDPTYEAQSDTHDGEIAVLGLAESFDLAVELCNRSRRLNALANI